MKKLRLTKRTEIIFKKGNNLVGILAFLSGLGANRSMISRLAMLASRRIGPEKLKKYGVRVHNKIEKMLQAVAVFK